MFILNVARVISCLQVILHTNLFIAPLLFIAHMLHFSSCLIKNSLKPSPRLYVLPMAANETLMKNTSLRYSSYV